MQYRQQMVNILMSTVLPSTTPWRIKTVEHATGLFSRFKEEREATFSRYATYEAALISFVDDAPKFQDGGWVVETYVVFVINLDDDEIHSWHTDGLSNNPFGKPRYRLSHHAFD